MTVQKHERRQRLALGGGTDVSVDSQVFQKPGNLRWPELSWMSSVMKVDEAAYPMNIRLFRARASVSNAEGSAYFIEQFGWLRTFNHLPASAASRLGFQCSNGV